ncbi:MAG: sodium-dependent dicarboxylate transporter 2/3/5, partial [Candidatus Pseudothioglobus sp.]
TAPNAIMFSTGRFTTSTMAREGVVLNLIGVVVITLVCATLLSPWQRYERLVDCR